MRFLRHKGSKQQDLHLLPTNITNKVTNAIRLTNTTLLLTKATKLRTNMRVACNSLLLTLAIITGASVTQEKRFMTLTPGQVRRRLQRSADRKWIDRK
jgi:hypothetical protein